MSDDTVPKRPLPIRPATGWSAWEATIGYIAMQYSPDAVLQLVAEGLPEADRPIWRASLTWGNHQVDVVDQISMIAALSALWEEVDRQHRIFKNAEAATK